jgi:hypothetical protein
MIDMDNSKQVEAPSDLFLVRVRSTTTEGKDEWCGRIQHVVSGKAYHFCSVESMVDLMAAMQHHTDTSDTAGDQQGPRGMVD